MAQQEIERLTEKFYNPIDSKEREKQMEQLVQMQVAALGENHPLLKPSYDPKRHVSILDTPLDQITEVKL